MPPTQHLTSVLLLLLLLLFPSPTVEPPPGVGTLDNATSPTPDATNTTAASPPPTTNTPAAANGTNAVVPDTATPSASPDATNTAAATPDATAAANGANGANAGGNAANIGEQPAADNAAGNAAEPGVNTAAAGDGVTDVPGVPPPVDAPIAAPPRPGAGRKMLQGNAGIGFGLPSAFQGFPFGTTTTNPQGTITTGTWGACCCSLL
jgi:hypothetical protein